jgi:RecA-family ATPase
VLIVSAEGSGIDRRIRAWLQKYAPDKDVNELKIAIIERRVNFNDDAETVALIEAIDTIGIKPALTVIDTLSKNSGALDENSNSEVKAYIGRIDNAIRRRFGGTVLLLHHTGHGEQGRARGASALEADTDAAYIIKREPGTKLVSVSRERFKDSADLAPLAYQAEIIDLGEKDEFDQPVTSIALVAVDGAEVASERQSDKGPRGSGQRQLLRALSELQKKSDGELIWTQAEVRAIGRDIGLTKPTAYSASAALCQFYLVPTVCGFRLRRTEEKG